MQVGDPVGVGGAGGLLLLAEARDHLHSGDARAGDAVDAIGQHIAAAGARDQRHAAHHQQGVGLVVAVGGLEQIEAWGSGSMGSSCESET